MTSAEALVTLDEYIAELMAILGRFTQTREALSIDSADDGRFHQIANELKDFFTDEFTDGSYRQRTQAAYMDAIGNWLGSPSYHGVETMVGIVKTAAVRVRRNPAILASTKVSTLKNDNAAKAARLVDLWNRFHVVVGRLRNRRQGRPTIAVSDEYDVQDLFYALLATSFDDVRKEEWTPSHAGAASRVDFLLPEIEAVVELKMTRSSLTTRDLGDQLIVDIERYKKHPQCHTLYCFVYDPENRTTNPRGLENDLSRNNPQEMNVQVMIVPKMYS